VKGHWSLALLAAFQLVQAGTAGGWLGAGYRSVSILILFVSVLIHEFSHCGMAILRGGHAHEILLWPLGGMAYVGHSGSPSDELRVAGVGPLSNFALAGLAFGGLALSGATLRPELFNPFESWWFADLSVVQNWTLHAFRLNAILGLFNLVVPAYPLDGGRVLFAFLAMRHGRNRAADLTAMIALPVGAALAVWGLAQSDLFILIIGVMVIFEAVQVRRLVREGMLDAHPGFGGMAEYEYMPDRPRRKGWFARWREKRSEERRRREAAAEAGLRDRVDAVLDKVSREGIGSLTAEERRVLDEASRRGRND
jgi:Zn-dependent protease